MKCKMAASGRQCLYKLGLLAEFLRASVMVGMYLEFAGSRKLSLKKRKIKKIQDCLEKRRNMRRKLKKQKIFLVTLILKIGQDLGEKDGGM